MPPIRISEPLTHYNISKYCLDHQWDLYKHTDGNIATMLAASGAILAIYFGILAIPENFLLKILSYSIIEFFFIIFFLMTIILSLFISIIFNVISLNNHDSFHVNPIKTIKSHGTKNEQQIKEKMTLELSLLWLKNDRILADKYKNIIKSHESFALGIISLGPFLVLFLLL